jgi:hypothetical protein
MLIIDTFLYYWNNFVSSELANLIFGSILTFTLQLVYKKTKQYTKKQFLKKELKKIKIHDTNLKVIDLANGDPDFSKENIFIRTVDIFGKTKSLYISLPEKYKNEIRKKEEKLGFSDKQKTIFHENTSFDGSKNFKDLIEITGITNLPQLIEKHRKIIGEQFINNKNGLLFNGSKYGIFNIEFKRFGEKEEPGVIIELFETDYFTHRVFRSCLLYTSPSPRDRQKSRMPSSA